MEIWRRASRRISVASREEWMVKELLTKKAANLQHRVRQREFFHGWVLKNIVHHFTESRAHVCIVTLIYFYVRDHCKEDYALIYVSFILENWNNLLETASLQCKDKTFTHELSIINNIYYKNF